MKRRLMAVLMACVMTLSLLPISALATDSGMVFTKDARVNEDGKSYTISMEAWATGKTTTQEKPQPLDIALVLDVSGSMADPFTQDSTTYTEVYAPALNKDNIYYVYTSYYGGYYYEVSWCSVCNAWTDGCFSWWTGHEAGTSYTPKQNAGDNGGTQFYVKQKTAGQSKLEALKMAVNSFIDGVAANSPESNISIVKFGGDKANWVGNDFYDKGGYTYNYTQIVTNPTPAETGKNALKAAVNSLQAAGATPADYGMQLAQAALASSTSGNSKVVVMFTDGEPNHQNGFDKKVATNVVNTAKSMKDGGTTIYTVGVFTNPSDNVKKYMNATSSNYPQATAEGKFNVTWGEGSDKGYYKTASSAAELNNIFTTISQDISSAANAALNASTTVVDTLSNYFTFADATNPVDSVKVYTADWNGNSWGIPALASGVDVRVEGKTVRVTGYDYAANYVHETQGQKLIIEITVVPSGVGCASRQIPTNADGNVPAAQVVLNQTVVTSAPGKTIEGHAVIYDLAGGQLESDFPTLYYPAGATVRVTGNVPTKDNHNFTGWMRDNDSVPANTPLAILNADITLLAQWELSTHSVTGTIDEHGKVTNGKQTSVKHNEACEDMVFTPDPGYKIDSVTVNGTGVPFTPDANRTYTYSKEHVTENIEVVVTTEIDDSQTKDLSYTVEYYKDGEKVDTDTQTVTKTVQVLEPNTLTVDKNKINTTNKYYGYKLEKTEPAPIPESIEDKGTIKVYYVKDEGKTKDLSYTVEYYKDGVKVDADTQTETKTVQVLEPDTLTVDKSKINTTDKYYGYKLEKTEPAPIPESIEDKGVIKVYYVKDDGQTQPTKYTVRYTIEGVEQENDKIEVEGSAWINDEPAMIAIAEGGIPTPSNKYNGYKLDPANPEYPAAGTPVESGSEYTVNYVKRTDLSYTVHYYLKDTTTKLADDKVVIDQTFGAAVTEKALDIAGYNVFGESEKTITIGVGANEIIFYYTRVVYPYVPVVKPALNRDDHYAYVVGYPDGMVRPSGNITRAEAATIFFRLLTDDSRNQFWMTTNTYSDVNRGDWFNNAVSTLSNAGIISGYPDGTFRPNAPITRAEMSKIIALFAKLNKSEDRFNDIAGHWAEAYIKLAAGNGWIAGYPDGSFKPQQNITRAETMTMINRVLERVPSVESHLLPYNAMLTFPDCQSGQWFYIAVQEATNSHTYERAASEKNGDEQWIALRANRDWTQFQN